MSVILLPSLLILSVLLKVVDNNDGGGAPLTISTTPTTYLQWNNHWFNQIGKNISCTNSKPHMSHSNKLDLSMHNDCHTPDK